LSGPFVGRERELAQVLEGLAEGSAVERARINVQRHVRKAIRAIAAALPDLGRHLDRSVKTGTTCRYDPG
jgi:hypothetical protein